VPTAIEKLTLAERCLNVLLPDHRGDLVARSVESFRRKRTAVVVCETDVPLCDWVGVDLPPIAHLCRRFHLVFVAAFGYFVFCKRALFIRSSSQRLIL